MTRTLRLMLGGALLLVCAALPALAQSNARGDAGLCVRGAPNAPIKIEVFSDFQCPACRTFYLETNRPVLADYASANKVCVVYREFPLRNHQHSRKAARYATAARRVGVWQWVQVTDRLYLDQSRWSQDGTVEATVARALSKEDLKRVEALLGDSAINAEIERDLALGRRQGVRSTPTFFITAQGKTERVTGIVQYSILRRYLDSRLGQ